MLRRLATLIVLLPALALSACGEEDEPASTTAPAAEETTTTSTEASPPAASEPDLSEKPTVEVPNGPPPKQLEVTDIVEGEGPEAAPGDVVTMQYVGVNYSDGRQFDASWDSGQPFPFQLGAGMVIKGWDEGIAGMKVGGRRELIIPPALGYGKAGSPPAIGPNETLVFVVDLLDVQ